MTIYNKKIKRELRALAEKAYQLQLDHELSVLEKSFDQWKNDEINCFELSNRIHDFHDVAASDLWKRYNYSNDYIAQIAIAIVEGHIEINEVPEEAKPIIEDLVSSNRDKT